MVNVVIRAVELALTVACIAVLGGYAGATMRQLAVWRDSETLYRNALAVEPNNFMMHYNFGTVLANAHRDAEALAEFERVLAVIPGYADAERQIGEIQVEDAGGVARLTRNAGVVHERIEPAVPLDRGAQVCRLRVRRDIELDGFDAAEKLTSDRTPRLEISRTQEHVVPESRELSCGFAPQTAVSSCHESHWLCRHAFVPSGTDSAARITVGPI